MVFENPGENPDIFHCVLFPIQSGACEDIFIVPEYCQKSIFSGIDTEKVSPPPAFNFREFSFKVW